MNQNVSVPLRLEVEVIENRSKPGCNSSSTSPLCTCPILASVKE